MLALCFTILSIPRVPTTTQPLQAVRLATDVDLPRIAQLQLDVFDPLPEAPPAAKAEPSSVKPKAQVSLFDDDVSPVASGPVPSGRVWPGSWRAVAGVRAFGGLAFPFCVCVLRGVCCAVFSVTCCLCVCVCVCVCDCVQGVRV